MPDGLTSVTAGLIGLGIGWLVSGYQRVGEKITEERRAAYSAMLAATDALRTGAADDEADRASALRSASAQAELISSPQLFRSGSIAALARAATSGGDEEYRRARDAFVAAARADGLANSAAFRWMRRGVYRRDP